jgi:hypothetical protein
MKNIGLAIIAAATIALGGVATHFVALQDRADAQKAFVSQWNADQVAAGDETYRLTLQNQADAAKLKAERAARGAK